jgi:NAD(P)-dependent dehydrogenase (short-subunit alcohol dehydrogenase family)
MPKSTKVLILGASRGLGLAMAAEWCSRGAHVFATRRQPSAPLSALADRYPSSLTILNADLDDATSIRALRASLGETSLDILFVNAGLALALGESAAEVAEADMLAMMRTNALGPVRALEILGDLVPKGGVLAAMSSELGSITNSGGGHWAFYSASKAALNMLVRGYAAQHGGNRAVLLVCPGWIRTDMGGAAATYSIDEAIPAVVDMVTAQQGRHGLRFVDRFGKTLPW